MTARSATESVPSAVPTDSPRILVVGDDGLGSASTSRALEAAGFSVSVVTSAEAALARLAAEDADLVLADVALPGLTGRDLCRVVRGDPARSTLPFLLATTMLDGAAPLSVLECRADGLVMKPIEPSALVRRVWSTLAKRRTWDKARGDSLSVEFDGQRVEATLTKRTVDSLTCSLDELVRANAASVVAHDALMKSHQSLERYAQRLELEVELTEGKYRALAGGAGDGLFVTDTQGVLLEINERGEAMLGASRRELLGHPLFAAVDVSPESPDSYFRNLTCTPKPRELVLRAQTDQEAWLEFSGSQMSGRDSLVLIIARDVTERRRTIDELKATETALRGAIEDRDRMQTELVQAQKLEAVGQLAAGIAHEINTPTQYIGDNVQFLRVAVERLGPILDVYAELADFARQSHGSEDLVRRIEQTLKKARLPYLREQMPLAIEQSLEGIERVSTIVQAMKEFSHPGSAEKTEVDINRAVRSTVTVARNEWKYVADLTLDLDERLPMVPCLPGEFNQAILNVIINAAHAIASKNGPEEKGKITLETRLLGDHVEVRIKDTGTGIPAAIKDKVFNPFFTTKKVGKGTGQGLAIARSVIVDKHKGRFFFESEEGEGTTFVIQLPLKASSEEKISA